VMVPTDRAAYIMHEARVHDAIPARDREATGDSFTNRAITSYNSSVYVCDRAGIYIKPAMNSNTTS
nr:hypothetical protein [Lachnospiraceae bacterium]